MFPTFKILVLLISQCFSIDSDIQRFECYRRIDNEISIYKLYSPNEYEMIPYKDWCSYVSCKYNKCIISNQINSCRE